MRCVKGLFFSDASSMRRGGETHGPALLVGIRGIPHRAITDTANELPTTHPPFFATPPTPFFLHPRYGTCAAVHATGACQEVLAGDTQGNFFSSYPLAEDGNYKFFLYTDAYKATISKDEGDVEEDVYEAYYVGLLLQGKKEEIPKGHVLRVGGDKYMHMKVGSRVTLLLRAFFLQETSGSAVLVGFGRGDPRFIPSRASALTLPMLRALLTFFSPTTTTSTTLQVIENETYQAKITDADGNEALYPVKIPEVHVLKKGKIQIFMGSKGGYFFMVKAESQGMGDTGAASLAAMAIGFYYACGADEA